VLALAGVNFEVVTMVRAAFHLDFIVMLLRVITFSLRVGD
jgi:hypothetical protein